ncbi:MAG: chemotaxis-specific protein-glutamate methyltransferase CheB [bacterium]
MRILLVDDSALYRKLLSDAALSVPGAESVAVSNGELALKRLETEKFDLVLLDVFMEQMSGPETLDRIKASHRHVPVVMVSGATGRDAEITIQCLAMGAMDFIPKPSGSSFESGMESLKAEIRRVAAMARVRNASSSSDQVTSAQRSSTASPIQKRLQPPPFIDLVLVGVSTGGPKALAAILPVLSARLPVPILLVQHMPAHFTKSLAEQLDKTSALSIQEATDGEIPKAGEVLIAPGGFHLEVFRNDADKFQTRITSAPPVNSCRPSADVLFQSAANCKLRGALAIILTGMGSDGADGVTSLKKACPTWCIAQDAATSTVYGMPQAIAQRDLHEEILPLQEIGPRVNRIFRL